MNEEDTHHPRQGILPVTIREKSALYAAYIPFVRNGGLFIPTNRQYDLGDEVFILLTLMDEPERIPLAGQVIWITPPGAEGYRMTGIGVQFDERDGGVTRGRIENYLAGAIESDRLTNTM